MRPRAPAAASAAKSEQTWIGWSRRRRAASLVVTHASRWSHRSAINASPSARRSNRKSSEGKQLPPYGGDGVTAPGPTGQGPSADLKRSEALLREARAALRRLDTLMSNAQAAQDPVTPLVAEARSGLERVVGQLARRRSTDERRLRAASKKKTRQR